MKTTIAALWNALTNPDITQQYWFDTRIESDGNVGSRVQYVRNAPGTFESELRGLSGIEVKRNATGQVAFALAFVKTLAEVERASSQLTRNAQEDAVLWIVYPKSTSRKYKCEFNRDTGWDSLGHAGYEPVRQVAVDEDWSALRFQKVRSRLPAAGRHDNNARPDHSFNRKQ